MSGSPETTNTLLMWLVIVTAAMPLLVTGLGVAGFVAFRRLSARVDREIQPVVQRAHALLDDAEHLAGVVRRRFDQVDETVTTLQHAGERVTGRLAGVVSAAAHAVEILLARAAPRAR